MRGDFRCPMCGSSFVAPVSLAGQPGECFHCRAHIVAWPEPRPAPESPGADDTGGTRPAPRRVLYAIAGAGLVVVIAAVAFVAFALVKSRVPVGPVRELDVYTSELARRVPIDTEGVKKSGYKVESYVTDDNHPAFFVELVIRVEPVRLHDAITDKTATYTRARLTRSYGQPPGVTSIRGNWRQAQTAALNAHWETVEMLP